MNRYIVAHWNDFTGELVQEEVEAESKFEALASYLEYPEDLAQNIDALEQYCANTDQMVSAIRVGKFHKKPDTPSWPFPPQTVALQ